MKDEERFEDVSLAAFFVRVWRAKIFVVLGILVGAVIAFGFGAVAVPHYKAQMIVSPANPINGAEVSSLLANNNSFATNYVLQRIGAGLSSDFLRFENSLAGVPVARILLEREDVRRALARDKSFSFQDADMTWSPEKFALYIDQRVHIDPVGATALRRLRYYHPDPEFAATFLMLLHGVTDNLIRQTIRARTEERVQYLKQAAAETLNPEHRRALTSLLLEQERLKMLVSIESDYTAEVVEPASSSHRALWPDRRFMFAVCMMFGAVLGFLIGGLWYERRVV